MCSDFFFYLVQGFRQRGPTEKLSLRLFKSSIELLGCKVEWDTSAVRSPKRDSTRRASQAGSSPTSAGANSLATGGRGKGVSNTTALLAALEESKRKSHGARQRGGFEELMARDGNAKQRLTSFSARSSQRNKSPSITASLQARMS